MIDVHNNLISLTLKFPTKKAIPLTLLSILTDYDGNFKLFLTVLKSIHLTITDI